MRKVPGEPAGSPKEGERRVYYGFWFEQAVRGKQWNQYQKVLQPLVQPQGLDPGAEPSGLSRQVVDQPGLRAGLVCQRSGGVDDDSTCGVLPDRQVNAMVAKIVEPPFPIALDKGFSLGVPGQIAGPIAGDDLVKNAEMIGDRLDQQPVRGGAQDTRTLRCRAQHGHDTLIVWQGFNLQGHPGSELALNIGLAAQQPERYQQSKQRVARQQGQQ